MVKTGERTRERSPQGEGARLRDELIAAAGRLLAADGDVDSLSLRGVAREAGVAAPSVYLHFASKEALLRAVVDAHFAALQQAIETGVASGMTPPLASSPAVWPIANMPSSSHVLTSCCSTIRDQTSKTPNSPELPALPPFRCWSTVWLPVSRPEWRIQATRSASRSISGRRYTGQPHCAGRPQVSPGRRWKSRCAAYWRRSPVSPTGIASSMRR